MGREKPMRVGLGKNERREESTALGTFGFTGWEVGRITKLCVKIGKYRFSFQDRSLENF